MPAPSKARNQTMAKINTRTLPSIDRQASSASTHRVIRTMPTPTMASDVADATPKAASAITPASTPIAIGARARRKRRIWLVSSAIRFVLARNSARAVPSAATSKLSAARKRRAFLEMQIGDEQCAARRPEQGAFGQRTQGVTGERKGNHALL